MPKWFILGLTFTVQKGLYNHMTFILRKKRSKLNIRKMKRF